MEITIDMIKELREKNWLRYHGLPKRAAKRQRRF